jgi:hypothetical protein
MKSFSESRDMFENRIRSTVGTDAIDRFRALDFSTATRYWVRYSVRFRTGTGQYRIKISQL